MKKELTCIICPRGCSLVVDTETMTVTGNNCARGVKYGIEEATHPVRTVTSILRVANRCDSMVSVKTAAPIAKEDMFQAMEVIRTTQVNAPIAIGDVLIANVCGTDIVATKDIR